MTSIPRASTKKLIPIVLGAIAGFERKMMLEGKAPRADREGQGRQIRKLAAEGLGRAEIARRLGVGERSVYRMLAADAR